jgi:hypothetical protein
LGVIGKRVFVCHLITIVTRYDMLVYANAELAFGTGYFMRVQVDNPEWRGDYSCCHEQ